MDIWFIEDPGVAFLKKERTLVAGDLHIGHELSLEREGLHVTGADKALGTKILVAYRRSGAKRIVFLGDMKASITYPDTSQYNLLREFFRPLSGIELHIAKGNHDSHLQDVLKQVNVQANISNEIILGNTAFIHGTSMPSEEAMMKRFLFAAHLHAMVHRQGKQERAWIISGISSGAKKLYKKHNKSIKLVIAPPANALLPGKDITMEFSESFLLFRRRVFEMKSSKVYAMDGELLGTARKISGI